MANYLIDGRRKLKNKLIRGVPNLPINTSLCTPSTANEGRHRLKDSSRKIFYYFVVALGKALLLLQFGSSFILVLEQQWLEVFII